MYNANIELTPVNEIENGEGEGEGQDTDNEGDETLITNYTYH